MGTEKNVTRRGLIGGAAAAAAGGALAASPAAAHDRGHGHGGNPPRRSEYLISGGCVLSIDPQIGDLARGDVHVKNGQIVAVGERLHAPRAQRIDARDKIVMPGLVETHWHLWNHGMRMYIKDGVAARQYFPVTNALGPHFTPSDTYRASRAALVEGVLAGMTTVHDWCHNVRGPEHADASIRALLDAGVRGRYSYGWAQGGPLDVPIDMAPIAQTKQRWFSNPGTTRGLLHLGFASRNLVPGQSPRGSIPVAIGKIDWAAVRALGLPITLHASPAGLVTMLEQEGMLGPDVLMVHPTLTTAQENAIVAARGTGWSMSAIGEARRGPAEQIRYYELVQAGAKLGLSVDASAGDAGDLFNAMRILVKMTSNRLGSTGLGARAMIELGTIEGARVLGLEDQVGSLTPGKRADIIMVNRLDPNMAPPGDAVTQLVEFARPSNVDTVMVDGKILKWRGELVDVDVERVVRDAIQSAAQIGARAGWTPA